MNAEAVDQLIALLKGIAHENQELQTKLAALERSMSEHSDVNGHYQGWAGRLRFVPDARASRQRTEEACEVLRQALLGDSNGRKVLGAAAGRHH